MIRYLLLICSALLLACCNDTRNNEHDKKLEAATTTFFDLIKEKKYDETEKVLSPQFMELVSFDEWVGLLNHVESFGAIEHVEIEKITYSKRDSATQATVLCKVTRSRQTIYEQFIFLEEDGKFKIINYEYTEDLELMNVDAEALDMAYEFYEDCKEGAYEKIAALMSDNLKESVSTKQLIAFLENKEKFGKLISYEKSGVAVRRKDGKIYCTFDFTVKHESMMLYEDLVLVKKDDTFHIDAYEYFQNRSKRHAHETADNNSKEVAEAFFQALEHQDPTELEDLLDDDAPAPEKWFEVMGAKEQVTGALINHFLLDNYPIEADGEQYYIYIYHTEYENYHLYEKLTLIARENGYFVYSYKYDEDKDVIIN